MPIDAVSPSPETPTPISVRLARSAPVATEGMRPWTALKPQALLRKYAVVFDEQPMPLIFATLYGFIPSSHSAWISAAVIASWPQPLHSVEATPSYSLRVSPSGLVFGAAAPPGGSGTDVVMAGFLPGLVGEQRFDDGVGVERQAVVVQDAADLLGRLGQLHAEHAGHLRVAVLLDDVHAVVLREEVANRVAERERAQAQVVELDALVAQRRARLLDRPVRRAEREEADLRRLLRGREDRRRDRAADRLPLLGQAVEVLLVGDVVLGVARLLVVAGAAREVRRAVDLRAGQRAVRDAVAVGVRVAAPAARAELLDVRFRQHLAAIEALGGVRERVAEPVVHAELEVEHHEHRRL